jgi:hypothetical protein
MPDSDYELEVSLLVYSWKGIMWMEYNPVHAAIVQDRAENMN